MVGQDGGHDFQDEANRAWRWAAALVLLTALLSARRLLVRTGGPLRDEARYELEGEVGEGRGDDQVSELCNRRGSKHGVGGARKAAWY